MIYKIKEGVNMDKINVLGDGYVRLINIIGNEDTVLSAIGIEPSKMDSTTKQWHLNNIILKQRQFSIFGHIILQFEFKMPIFLIKKYFTHVNDTVKTSTLENINSCNDLNFYIPGHLRSKTTGKPKEINNYLYDKLELYHNKAAKIYESIIEEDINPEDAFMILPQSVFLTFFETGDLLNYYSIYENFYSSNIINELKAYASAIDSILTKHLEIPWTLLKTTKSL